MILPVAVLHYLLACLSFSIPSFPSNLSPASFYIADRSKDREGRGLSQPPAFLPLCLWCFVAFGFSQSKGTATSYPLESHLSNFLVSSRSSRKPKGCLPCLFASVPTIFTSFLSLLFLVFSFSNIRREKEDEETIKNHFHIFLYSYLFYVLLFLLSLKKGRGIFFLPSHSSVCFHLSFPTRNKREKTREGGERGERERFGAEKGEGSCLLVCLTSTHKRLK